MNRLLAVAIALSCVGCPSVTSGHMAADRALFDAVAPEYRDAINTQRDAGKLTRQQWERRLRTIYLWGVHVEAKASTLTASDLGEDIGE